MAAGYVLKTKNWWEDLDQVWSEIHYWDGHAWVKDVAYARVYKTRKAAASARKTVSRIRYRRTPVKQDWTPRGDEFDAIQPTVQVVEIS